MLLGKKGSSWFVAKMRTSIAEKLNERALIAYADKNFSSMQRSFLTDLIAGLVVDAIRWWLEQGRPYTPEQIATRVYHMIFAILKDAHTWH
ncbi:hypothetical protein KSF_078870 [Reticulibacter mediterranei]|uniref:Transcriptional regulator TetR C-terminal Firmicutes type domain-containing protein n=1 Tax=Reticulibacter mediterranei TaxID=2778369 RepID=A0A8J3N4B2_9CHLR|nr:TetR-like C-terminal domain-containing protein [Reticulibacter mediterranei]GHO97839.1 hypothetical protein KSF_078870 [Reticulibacter mediterranei]